MGTSNCPNCKDLEERLQRALEVAQNRLDEYVKLEAENKILRHENTNLTWRINPEGMGR